MKALIESVRSRIRANRPKQWSERFTVVLTDREVRVVPVDERDAEWRQSFCWTDVSRTCFRDMGPWDSDLLYFELTVPGDDVVVPLEAAGGDELFQALRERGLFPDDIASRALRSTDGGLYCWPESDDEATHPG